MMLRRVTYGLCALAIVFGAWGLADRMLHGHQNAGYGGYVVWGLWVAMYLFFAGIAAGCFLMATLDLLFQVPRFKGTGRIAIWIALISLGAALFQIGLDLGHMDRIWKVYLQGNPRSLMFQMVWGYSLFGALLVAILVLSAQARHAGVLRILMVLGIPLSLFISGAVGALLGVAASRPYWHVGLLPVQFPVFSLASGAAAMMAAVGLFDKEERPHRADLLHTLSILTILLAVVKLYFLWADFSQSMYGNIPHNVEAVHQVLYGTYWWGFWILQLFLGTLVPIGVLLHPSLARNGPVVGWSGVLVLFGFAVARCNIVFPALTVPELDALTTAFSSSRLSFQYFPSLMEWAITIGASGGAVLASLIGRDWLMRKEQEAAQI